MTMEDPSVDSDPKPLRSLLHRLGALNVPRGDGLAFVVLFSVVVFLVAVEATTGVLLALYYRPSVADANASVRFVVTDVEYGALVRAVHHWAAHGLLVACGATLAWAVLRRAYRAPNAFAWVCGVGVAFLAMLETATGAMLPWTRQSVIEAEISSTLAGQVPVVGPLLRGLMLGGSEPGDLALARILGVHAGALPMALTFAVLLLALHAAGCTPRKASEQTMPLAPNAALRASIAAAVTVIVLLLLSSFRTPPLAASAEVARASASGIKPSWFLAFMHQMLEAAPARMIGIPSASVITTALVLSFGAFALFPLVDRRGSRAMQAVVLVALAAIVGGTIRALLS
jgi:quinol-cytochrome oxidoreductase complex cytochrome b subunit